MMRGYQLVGVCGLSALAAPGLGQVQTVPASGTAGLEEIIVTAQRHEERLQDVPIAVSAVTATQLKTSVVQDVTDLRVAVPALQSLNGNGYNFTQLRGVGGTADGPGIETPIATYVDGVYYGSPQATLLNLADAERVEVLKGPQGTLFGRNATGGLVQIITKDPTQETTGSATVGYGNYQTLRVGGYLAGGIAENLAANLSFQYTRQPQGWGRDTTTGAETYNEPRDLGLRSKWVFSPSEDTKITLAFDYSNTDNTLNSVSRYPGTLGSTVVPFSPAALAAAPPFLTPTPYPYPAQYRSVYDTDTDQNAFLRGWQGGTSLRWNQDFGVFRLATISAFRENDYRRVFDFDLTPLPGNWLDVRQRDSQASQEIQLLSQDSTKLSWTAGAFYYNARGEYRNDTLVVDAPNAGASAVFGVPGTGLVAPTRSDVATVSSAGYAQGTLTVLPATRVTLGVRFTHESKTLEGEETAALIPSNISLGVISSADQPPATINKFTYRLSIDHRFRDDWMTYASFNRGFKSGGFNAGSLTVSGYGPETLDAFEVGSKATLLEQRVRLNAALFYYDYKNIQLQVIEGTATAVVNGPSAQIYGLDSDLEARVTNDLRLTMGLQVLRDNFNTFKDAPFGTVDGGVPLTVGDASGNNLPYISHVTLSLAPNYTVPISNGSSVLLSTAYYFNSGFYPLTDNLIKQKAFSVFNASAKWTSSDGHKNFSFWGKNLNDSKTVSIIVDLPYGQHYTQWSAPRTYGASFGFEF